MRIIVLILLLPFNTIAQDALLQVMTKYWKQQESEVESSYVEEDEEEVYSWDLGRPDNQVDTEFYYDDFNPCE
jgi:hypothetical protein